MIPLGLAHRDRAAPAIQFKRKQYPAGQFTSALCGLARQQTAALPTKWDRVAFYLNKDQTPEQNEAGRFGPGSPLTCFHGLHLRRG